MTRDVVIGFQKSLGLTVQIYQENKGWVSIQLPGTIWISFHVSIVETMIE